MERRTFIKQSLKAGIGASLLLMPQISVGQNRNSLSILFTNDWHSRIEPFPMDGGKYAGLGGASKRAALINQIRKTQKHTLLLDAGDIWQGTPFFNFFHGELEYKLMSEMGYDAVTLGNHDFDAGLEGLEKQLPLAKFDILCANYNFDNTILKDKFQPYKVYVKGGTRIGVIGIGIELKNLVPPTLCKDVIYLDPIETANKYAKILKEQESCDLIICLSHLGYQYGNDKISDMVLAKESVNIDLILGGHTHTFLDSPVPVLNKNQQIIHIAQTGWAGINLGKIDYERHRSINHTDAFSTLIKIS